MEFNLALEFHPTIRMLSNCIERLQINSCHYEIMPSALTGIRESNMLPRLFNRDVKIFSCIQIFQLLNTAETL